MVNLYFHEQETLTIPTFAKGLSYYLSDNYMKAATPQELHQGLQKAYNEDFPEKPLDIDYLMGTWENAAGKKGLNFLGIFI